MHLFEFFVYNTNDFEICSKSGVIRNELKHCFEHLTQVMNKPISSLFVFGVVYCVAFKQKLKKTGRKHKNNKKKHNKQQTKNFKKNTHTKYFQPTNLREK